MSRDVKGTYCCGTTEDAEDIIDFANMVFSMDYNSINFASLLPKAYSEERCHMLSHHMIKEGGKIRALIDTYPLTLKQKDCELSAVYIGTVSVHPNSRGKGYMTELMERLLAAAEGDYDLLLLDGNRHRYQHFGFEKAGTKYHFNVGFRNICHCCKRLYEDLDNRVVCSFELVEPEMSDFAGILDKMYGLYLRRNVTARSFQDFYLCLQSWNADTYAVFKGKEFAGYINISEDEKSIFELELENNLQMAEILYDLMETFGITELGITVGMDDVQKIECLDKLSNYYNLGMSHQIKILNYKTVLEFLFKWKQKYDTLVTGEYVIGVISEDNRFEQKNYMVKVADNTVEVRETQELADIALEELELVRTLTTSYFFHAKQRVGSPLKNAPAGWFPLPFFLPDADAF